MEKVFELIPYLSPQSQQVVRDLVRQLCKNEGANVPLDQTPGLKTLEDGIPLWEAWMVSQYRPGSIRLYVHYIRRLLGEDPSPTTFSIQQRQAAELLSGMSAMASKNEFKAIKSFFGYLYEPGGYGSRIRQRT